MRTLFKILKSISFEIALISFGLVEERICGLSIPAVAARHNHARSAPVWLRVIESIAFSLFTETLGSVSVPEEVGRSMHSRSVPVCSFDLTPAVLICQKEMEVSAPPACTALATGLANY